MYEWNCLRLMIFMCQCAFAHSAAMWKYSWIWKISEWRAQLKRQNTASRHVLRLNLISSTIAAVLAIFIFSHLIESTEWKSSTFKMSENWLKLFFEITFMILLLEGENRKIPLCSFICVYSATQFSGFVSYTLRLMEFKLTVVSIMKEKRENWSLQKKHSWRSLIGMD